MLSTGVSGNTTLELLASDGLGVGEARAAAGRKGIPGRGNGAYRGLEARTQSAHLGTSERPVCHKQRRGRKDTGQRRIGGKKQTGCGALTAILRT